MRGEAGDWVVGRITTKATELNCDVKDYEKLLRVRRSAASFN